MNYILNISILAFRPRIIVMYIIKTVEKKKEFYWMEWLGLCLIILLFCIFFFNILYILLFFSLFEKKKKLTSGLIIKKNSSAVTRRLSGTKQWRRKKQYQFYKCYFLFWLRYSVFARVSFISMNLAPTWSPLHITKFQESNRNHILLSHFLKDT